MVIWVWSLDLVDPWVVFASFIVTQIFLDFLIFSDNEISIREALKKNKTKSLKSREEGELKSKYLMMTTESIDDLSVDWRLKCQLMTQVSIDYSSVNW